MTPTRTTISGRGAEEDRIRELEIVVSKHVQHLDDLTGDVHEIKTDVKDLRSGQRSLVIGLFMAAISFMGAAAAILSVAN